MFPTPRRAAVMAIPAMLKGRPINRNSKYWVPYRVVVSSPPIKRTISEAKKKPTVHSAMEITMERIRLLDVAVLAVSCLPSPRLRATKAVQPTLNA